MSYLNFDVKFDLHLPRLTPFRQVYVSRNGKNVSFFLFETLCLSLPLFLFFFFYITLILPSYLSLSFLPLVTNPN